MAQGATPVQQTIDQWLDYLTKAWQDLPRVERDIDRWDLIEQIDYVEEWTPKLELGNHLAQLLESPEATREQHQRYEHLRQLVQANQPILDRLRAS